MSAPDVMCVVCETFGAVTAHPKCWRIEQRQDADLADALADLDAPVPPTEEPRPE